MIKQALTAIAVAASVAACSSGDKPNPPVDILGTCETVEITRCTGDPKTPHLNLNTQNKITVTPPNVCALNGSTLKWNITPANPNRGWVLILPKDPANSWLIGANSPDRSEIEIDIPEGLSGDFDYYVVLQDGRCLDPRVHVE